MSTVEDTQTAVVPETVATDGGIERDRAWLWGKFQKPVFDAGDLPLSMKVSGVSLRTGMVVIEGTFLGQS